MSIESPRKRAGRRNSSLKPADEAKAQQRKQVIEEFYATEKTYVDGLELIYSASEATLYWKIFLRFCRPS